MCDPTLTYELARDRGQSVNVSPEVVRALPFGHELFATDTEQLAALAAERPWRADPHYFQKAYISALALTKMTSHAHSGGDIEVMGMMLGRVIRGGLVVTDAYALPVEGTETRVNAHEEGYEFMVQYLESYNQIAGRSGDRIVGWYHSHPGYGCWLSGIDVATQKLQQRFQDPFMAVVIDPHRTMSQKRVEIGAFRTYEDIPGTLGLRKGAPLTATPQHALTKMTKAKAEDFGAHAADYYSLLVVLFKSEIDTKVLETCVSSSWALVLSEPSAIPSGERLRLALEVTAYGQKAKDTRPLAPRPPTLGFKHSRNDLKGSSDDEMRGNAWDEDSESDTIPTQRSQRRGKSSQEGMRGPPAKHEAPLAVNALLAALAKQARAMGSNDARGGSSLQVQKQLFLQG